MGNLKLRLLSNIVIAYLLVAFTWWSVLLYTKNKDAFVAKANYIQLILVAEGKINSAAEFEATPAYQDLQKRYVRQEYMIFGEALFFIISLVIGIYLINRGYNREVVAAQERRNFLLSITHELKSPISSIRLVLETVLRRQLDKPKIDELNGMALEETDRLTSLVEDLLLAAKMETSYQPDLQPVNPVQTIDNLLTRLRKKFPDNPFIFNHQMEVSEIMADKQGINSIVINLLENAVKYSPPKSAINIDLQQKGDQVELKVSDQGFGINEKEKKKIFQRFYRVGNEDTRSTKGTGLGLYIVKEIVEAHLGRITVKDNQPTGTLFHILLPVKPEIKLKEYYD